MLRFNISSDCSRNSCTSWLHIVPSEQGSWVTSSDLDELLTLLRRISERGLKQALNNLDTKNADVYQHILDEINRVKS